MHEFSICRSILRQVTLAAEQRGNGRVRVIRLRLGPLAGVSATELERAMPLVSQGSIADGAAIVTELVPLRVACEVCGAESTADPARLACGACGNHKVRPLSGDELLLVGIELAQ